MISATKEMKFDGVWRMICLRTGRKERVIKGMNTVQVYHVHVWKCHDEMLYYI
jgi:hypothetical protein